jgi:hypothetical protein
MTTIKARLKDLGNFGFSPKRRKITLRDNFGLKTSRYDEITYFDGFELITEFDVARRRGDINLALETNRDYLTSKDGEMNPMLKYLESVTGRKRIEELLRPLEDQETTRNVRIGNYKVRKIREDSDNIRYCIALQFHRIVRLPCFGKIATAYDLLLPHSDYFSRDFLD